MVGGDIPLKPLSGRTGYQRLDHDDRSSSLVRAMPSSRTSGPSSSSRTRPRKSNLKYPDDAEDREHLLGGEFSADDADYGRVPLDDSEDPVPQTQPASDSRPDDASSIQTVRD